MMGFHIRMGNGFGFNSLLSCWGLRSECEWAMSTSTITSVRDALDVGELSGNIRVAAELEDDSKVLTSLILFAS